MAPFLLCYFTHKINWILSISYRLHVAHMFIIYKVELRFILSFYETYSACSRSIQSRKFRNSLVDSGTFKCYVRDFLKINVRSI